MALPSLSDNFSLTSQMSKALLLMRNLLPGRWPRDYKYIFFSSGPIGKQADLVGCDLLC